MVSSGSRLIGCGLLGRPMAFRLVLAVAPGLKLVEVKDVVAGDRFAPEQFTVAATFPITSVAGDGGRNSLASRRACYVRCTEVAMMSRRFA